MDMYQIYYVILWEGQSHLKYPHSYHVFTTSDGPGMPRFAYSVIVLTISAAAAQLANRGKTGQILETQQDFKI